METRGGTESSESAVGLWGSWGGGGGSEDAQVGEEEGERAGRPVRKG